MRSSRVSSNKKSVKKIKVSQKRQLKNPFGNDKANKSLSES